MNALRMFIRTDQRGFTLIETIVTIMISAVLAIILAQVIANQTGRSYGPIRVINENLALRAVMENIAADCSRGASTLALQSRVTNGEYWNNPAFTFSGAIPISIVENDCVVFDASGNEAASSCASSNLLKVTLAAGGTAHRLTSLFAP